MWIQVRSMDGLTTHRVDGLSKLTKIDELRDMLVDAFHAQPKQQRLFYRGKQLEDSHTLFDYDVRQNDLIQIMVRKTFPVEPISYEDNTEKNDMSDKENIEPAEIALPVPSDSTHDAQYKVGDILDGRDPILGCWHEITIKNIVRATSEENKQLKVMRETAFPQRGEADDYIYHIMYEGLEDEIEAQLRSYDIRPRARHLIKLADVEVGDKVMVNHNLDEPKQRGYWYDAVVTGKKVTRSVKELYSTLYFGSDLAPLHDCTIIFPDEIFAIEPPNSQKNIHLDGDTVSPVKRTSKPDCDACLDNPKMLCKECACTKCGGKDQPAVQLICDECNAAWHIFCLTPPLASVPDVDEWYCPLCKNDDSVVVRAGEKLKASKKKSKMASASGKSTRDWGKGMATVGRTTECTIVPKNHFGPIPGVEVGTMWKFRVQVSEAGVHRPHVAGIAARENEGAFSIVLSGGYEDDVDNGDSFEYTGSGGRDLSGNKRTAEQSSDQKLTKSNLGLAKNCNASLNTTAGAESKDWKSGKPVRVVRNCKLSKHSKYAPQEGNRYDGVYKLVKYWPQKGQSGFLVWRYFFRRDDPAPAPWTKAGKKRTEELGLVMQYPDGYEEKQKELEGKGSKKRKNCSSSDDDAPVKKSKIVAYKPPAELAKNMKLDERNKKLWTEAMSHAHEGSQTFLAHVQELFACICCQDLVYQPVTTECKHNFCKSCIRRAFKAQVYTCPSCRFDLGKDYKLSVNEPLSAILVSLLPGYGAGR
ncbi:E3 ubiquitin-protein ligase UHRF1-like [Watersipora subatra]|uniref:E3 ubiquitin-protein ligase UHRF1-like n=1 Tax=Watersipora subatra TaxID=2589382 RepID=UPI00355B1A9A